MKIISLIIFLVLVVIAPLSAYLFIRQNEFELDQNSRSINYVLNPKDFEIEIDFSSNILILNKESSSVKIELDSESIKEFQSWIELEDNIYLPPSSCNKLEVNLAMLDFKKNQNIKFNSITCVD